MKKEEKFHLMKILRASGNEKINSQVLFAISGTANCGIYNGKICCVFRAEIPPFMRI